MSSTPLGSDGSAPDGTTEFPCSACGRMLKVPIAAIGKQAKCPQCAVVQAVPPIATAIASGSDAIDARATPTPVEPLPTASAGMDSYGAATEAPANRLSTSPAPSATSAPPPELSEVSLARTVCVDFPPQLAAHDRPLAT